MNHDVEPASLSRNLLEEISGKLAYLSPAVRKVAEYILGHPEESKFLTISGLARRVWVAESTISRFVRELGIQGFSDFRVSLSEAIIKSSRHEKEPAKQPFVYEGILKTDTTDSAIDKVIRNSLEAIERTFSLLVPSVIDRVVADISEARSKYFVATGGSSIAAENGLIRFVRAGKKCWLFRDPTLQIMTAAALDNQDFVLGISDSGSTTGVVHALEIAKTHGCRTAAITSAEQSPLTQVSNNVIYTSRPSSGKNLYGEAVTAKWGQLAAIDALYVSYALRNYGATVGFLEETFVSGIRETRL